MNYMFITIFHDASLKLKVYLYTHIYIGFNLTITFIGRNNIIY